MKSYPYNRASALGRRIFKLLDVQFNQGALRAADEKSFREYDVPSVMECRVNKARFLFPSNLSGIRRPQIHVTSDVEQAWGDFAKGVSGLDFTHDQQELPLTYVQPLEDDTLKLLIDAGLYRDEHFEELMSKLMTDEVFDAEADMHVTYMDLSDTPSAEHGQNVPVLLVDPVHVTHDGKDPSTHTTLANLVKRSARLAIELRKEGVKTEELVRIPEAEQDKEVIISDEIRDIVTAEEEKAVEQPKSFKTASKLLDREIDVTDELKDSFSINQTSEDDRIRDLKDRERQADLEPEKPEPASKTTESAESLDEESFGKGLEDYSYESEDDGPDL